MRLKSLADVLIVSVRGVALNGRDGGVKEVSAL